MFFYAGIYKVNFFPGITRTLYFHLNPEKSLLKYIYNTSLKLIIFIPLYEKSDALKPNKHTFEIGCTNSASHAM